MGNTSTVTVTNANQLQAALASAHAGETILLASGNYGALSIYDRNFSGGSVTISSANSSAKAVFTSLQINQSSGLSFSGLEIDVSKSTTPYPNTVLSSSNISFSGMDIHGNLNSAGLEIRNSSSVTVLSSNFENLADGISELNNASLNITGNSFSYIEGDGIDNAGTTGIAINNNTFTNFYGGSTSSHPDAIQFWTTNTTVASSNVTIDNNTVTIGSGAQIQGIFMTDQVGDLAYQNVKIEGNTVTGENWNGITVDHASGLVVSENSVIGLSDSGLTLQSETSFGVASSSGIAVENASGATVSGNNSSTYTFVGDANINLSANAIDGTLQQKVIYSASTAIMSNLEQELVLTGSAAISGTAVAGNQTVTANSGGDRLYDSSFGNDTLIGGGGSDTLISRNPGNVLTGGAGNNTFQIMNKTGNVTITDFELSGTHNNINISSLLSAGLHPILSQEGNNTVISFTNASSTITLLGVHDNQLVATATGFHL